MFNSVVIEVVIGLAFLYLLLSLMCSAVTEMIARALDSRSKVLKKCIAGILSQDATLQEQFWSHPLVTGLSQKDGAPSYISSHVFATALLDVLAPTAARTLAAGSTIASLRSTLGQNTGSPVAQGVLALLDNAEDNVESVVKNVEQWYDSSMERASGWYKSLAQKRVFGIAIVLVLLANADTIAIGSDLWNQPALRQSYAQAAERYLEYQKKESTVAVKLEVQFTALKEELGTLGIEIGLAKYGALFPRIEDGNWVDRVVAAPKWPWISKIAGMFVTVLAVSLGAPFWFELLNRVVNLRQSGGLPTKQEPPATT